MGLIFEVDSIGLGDRHFRWFPSEVGLTRVALGLMANQLLNNVRINRILNLKARIIAN